MRQKFYKYPFASAGTLAPGIADATDPNGFVSYQMGWTFDYQRNLTSDALAKSPTYINLNVLLNDITTNLQQYQLTGTPEYVQASQNGNATVVYRLGAMVLHSSNNADPFRLYLSVIDNNANVPPGTGWTDMTSQLGSLGGVLTGSLPNPGMAGGAAAANVGTLGGVLTGTLPSPGMASGAAATNVGTLGGDLAGTLPNAALGAGAAVRNIGYNPAQANGGINQLGPDTTPIVIGFDANGPRIQVGGTDWGSFALLQQFGNTVANNGVIRIPGSAGGHGLIIQFGNKSLNAGQNQVVTLNVPFPNAGLWAGCSFGSQPPTAGSCGATTNGTNSILIGSTSNNTPNTIFWMAVGW